jgi:hypothetical protein
MTPRGQVVAPTLAGDDELIGLRLASGELLLPLPESLRRRIISKAFRRAIDVPHNYFANDISA